MNWPGMMKRKTAAAYCDLSEAAFEREVIAGRLPASVMLGGREHWRKEAIDRALDLIGGNVDQSYRRKLQQRLGRAA
jgi:predicted DNA-binding transcriptional regulator AlpA